MEKLTRRSDGFAETISGKLAISPTRFSGKDSDFKWFDFRRTATAPVTRVRWRIDDKIAVIDAPVASFMIGKRYADNVTDRQINEWNDKVAELDLDAPSLEPGLIVDGKEPEVIQEGEEQKPTEQPSEAQQPATATQTPATAQTAPEAQDLANNSTTEANGTAPGATPATTASEANAPADQTAEKAVDESSTGAQPKGKKPEKKGLL
jgi:hypothetical protein